MIGVLLAAGRSRRLGTITDDIPKTLLPVKGDTPILEIILANLRAVGVREVVVVTGYHAEMIEASLAELGPKYELAVETIYNETYLEWNNCYSLWLARDAFKESVFVINADTVHPAAVEQTLLDARGADVLLAMDDKKVVGEEELKVLLAGDGSVAHLSKQIPPDEAHGEHIGVSIVEGRVADDIAECLEHTWRRDPVSLYFEDGYNEFIARGGRVEVAPIGEVRWIEVDNAEDYTRAGEIAAQY